MRKRSAIDRLCHKVAALEGDMVRTLCDLVALPSVAPREGGGGERAKAKYLARMAGRLGLGDVEWYEAPDEDAPEGCRPNLVVRMIGQAGRCGQAAHAQRRMWFVSHMDVVPEGDRTLWSHDPFEAVVKCGRIYGRGVNDNCQEIVSSLYAAIALAELGIDLAYETCLCFVADEELGSEHGLKHLLSRGLFSPEDIVYVPDSGSLDGSFIEVAEKSLLWIQFEVKGTQVHASVPNRGVNACRVANELSCRLDRALGTRFHQVDPLFDPPGSTFEPTRRQANVANINTVPGREVLAFDCRVLPEVDLAEVQAEIERVATEAAAVSGASISVSYPQINQAPPATEAGADAVLLLKRAVQAVLPVEVQVGGIGGGTCATFFRRAGIPAVVWSQGNDSAHQPDENAEIAHVVNEAKVFALTMSGLTEQI